MTSLLAMSNAIVSSLYTAVVDDQHLSVQQGTLSQSTQRQASMVLPPPSMGSGGTLSSGLSQTVRQASLGLPQGPGTIGPVTRQQSLGLPQSQGSLGLAPSASLGTAQRQGSLGLPFEPSPQDLQVSTPDKAHNPPPTPPPPPGSLLSPWPSEALPLLVSLEEDPAVYIGQSTCVLGAVACFGLVWDTPKVWIGV